jgi:hypothetical protein
MLASGKMKAKDTAIYVVAQCLGSIVAAMILYGVAVGTPGYNLAVNGLGQNGYGQASPGGFSMISGFIAEVILTFIFFFACDLRINYQESPSRFRRHFHWSKPCPHPPRRDPDNGHVCEPRKKPRPSSRGGWYSFEPALAILGRPDCRRTHRCTGLAPAGIMITPTLTRFHGNGLSDIYIY